MNLAAFLAPDDIPTSLISEGAEDLPKPLATAAADPLGLDKAVAALRRYSLAEVAEQSISVHRLVQAVAAKRIRRMERESWCAAAVALVNAAFPFERDDPSTWLASGRLLPHALASAGHAEAVGVAPEATGRLLNEAGLYLRLRAQFPEARAVMERALSIVEDTYGPDHPTVATHVNNLGNVLRDLGDLEGARTHFERALAISKKADGPDHPTAALRVNNLGGVRRGQHPRRRRVRRLSHRLRCTAHRRIPLRHRWIDRRHLDPAGAPAASGAARGQRERQQERRAQGHGSLLARRDA